MAENIRTYLVGRRNSSVACDIALPETEKSVSRKHLELTVTATGQCYIVHVHPQNTTQVQRRDGRWEPISQDYVELDSPLLLGAHQTSARKLLELLGPSSPPPPVSPISPTAEDRPMEWDPERGTFLRR